MPKVYSDPLHEDIKNMIEACLKTDMDEKTKNHFEEMLQKIKAAPTWRPGQAYENPTIKVSVKTKKV